MTDPKSGAESSAAVASEDDAKRKFPRSPRSVRCEVVERGGNHGGASKPRAHGPENRREFRRKSG